MDSRPGQERPSEPGETPPRDFRAPPAEEPGPGRQLSPPEDLDAVLIGWFGPADPADPLHGDLWTAASLAIEEANAEGGFEGLPFRLLPRWSKDPWGSGVAEVFRLAYEDRVWAVLGGVDGSSTHLAEQVVAKARLPLVSPVATDKSVNLAGVPWMFSLAPGDHLWAPAVAEGLLERVGEHPFVMLAATDHDSRLAAGELISALQANDRGPVLQLDVEPGAGDLDRLLAPLAEIAPAGFLLAAGIEDSARLLIELRRRGFDQPVFGTPRMARRRCRELAKGTGNGAADESAGGPIGEVWLPRMLAADGPEEERRRFAARFRERAGAEPDWAALSSYDAVRLLAAALRRAGLDREGLRQALLGLAPWPGLAGPVSWDPTGQNDRAVADLEKLDLPAGL